MDWFGSWRWKWLDGDGTVLREGAGKNLLHNTGQQFILQNAFGPLTDNLTVLCEDCSYTTATNTLADVDTANTAFATVIIGDKIYVAGGTDNEATPGLYTVASNADNDTVASSQWALITGPRSLVVMLRQRPRLLKKALVAMPA